MLNKGIVPEGWAGIISRKREVVNQNTYMISLKCLRKLRMGRYCQENCSVLFLYVVAHPHHTSGCLLCTKQDCCYDKALMGELPNLFCKCLFLVEAGTLRTSCFVSMSFFPIAFTIFTASLADWCCNSRDTFGLEYQVG